MKLWPWIVGGVALGAFYVWDQLGRPKVVSMTEPWTCRPGEHCNKYKSDGSWSQNIGHGEQSDALIVHRRAPENLSSLVVIHEADSYTTYGTPGTQWPNYGVAAIDDVFFGVV